MTMQMSIKVKKKEILPLMYCVFTSIYYTLRGWKYSTKILDVLLIIAVICGLVNAFQHVLNKARTLMIMIPLIILIIYRMSLGADARLFVSLVAVLVGMSVNFDKIASWILSTKTIIFVFCLLMGGYVHLNYISMNMGVILFLTLYIYYPKNKIKSFILAVIIYVLGVFVSKSGAMIVCAGAGLILYIIVNTKIGKRILTSKAMAFLFPMVLFLNWFLAALYSAYGYSNPNFCFIKNLVPKALNPHILPFLNILDIIVSGRISLAAYSIEKFGVSLWGGNINYNVDTGLPYFLIDSGMILLLQDWGIVMAIVVMLAFIFLMFKLVKKKEYRLIISAIVISLWAFNEDALLAVGTNYLFYVIGYELYNSRKEIATKMKNVYGVFQKT